jgi:hypothetical protein
MSWPGLIGVEKIEDQKARAAIKAQIEVSCVPLCPLTSQADKRERAEKAAREKAAREGATLPPRARRIPKRGCRWVRRMRRANDRSG